MTNNKSDHSESSSPGFGQRERINKNIITAKEMIENDITEIPFLWGHFLPKYGLAMLAGESDSGKSTLIRQLSLAIVTEQDTFLGFDLNSDTRSIIYVCTEDDVTSISARLKMEFDSTSSTEPYSNLRYLFDEEDICSQLEEELEERPADCVIIDALGDIIQGDGNNMISVRNFYKPYKRLAKRHNCLILFVHHTRKSSGNHPGKTDVSGSQAFEAKPRALLMLGPGSGSKSNKELSIEKGNLVPEELKKTKLSLRINENGVFELLDATRSSDSLPRSKTDENVRKVFKLKENGLSYRKIEDVFEKEGVKMSKTKIGKILKGKENEINEV